MRQVVKEVISTLHVNAEDLPFVRTSKSDDQDADVPGSSYRLLHVSADQQLTVVQTRNDAFYVSGLHRHVAPTFGYTLTGLWGHDKNYEYGPGTYVYEPPGSPHRFYNGPGVTEALFISQGPLEFLDPESGEVVFTLSTAGRAENYLGACEAAGLPRPNILT